MVNKINHNLCLNILNMIFWAYCVSKFICSKKVSCDVTIPRDMPSNYRVLSIMANYHFYTANNLLEIMNIYTDIHSRF